MTTLTATEVRVLSLLLERALALPATEREAFIAALPERQQVRVPRLRERLASLVPVEAEAALGIESTERAGARTLSSSGREATATVGVNIGPRGGHVHSRGVRCSATRRPRTASSGCS